MLLSEHSTNQFRQPHARFALQVVIAQRVAVIGIMQINLNNCPAPILHNVRDSASRHDLPTGADHKTDVCLFCEVGGGPVYVRGDTFTEKDEIRFEQPAAGWAWGGKSLQ